MRHEVVERGVPVGDVEERAHRIVDPELEPQVHDHRRAARVVDVHVLEVAKVPPEGDVVDTHPGEDPLEEQVVARLLQRGDELAKARDEHRLPVVDLDAGAAEEPGEDGEQANANQQTDCELDIRAHEVGSFR